jgi:2-polyprenyl-3-methyl-5-hydroxy-6-metoxy-1,4-benzoquinol methylase
MHIKKYSNDDQQYEKLTADLYNNFKDIVLPPEYANFVQNNSIQLLIRLARYKFVSRMIRPRDRVLEIGSGSGLGATFLGQHCNSVTGIEIKSREVEEARSINRRDNVDFKLVNFFDYSVDEKFDAIVSLDVIEHVDEDAGRKFMEKTVQHLNNDGMVIVGTPSCYSYEYQSEPSKAAHVKLYDQQELVEMVEKYYGRVIVFSMNDEMVHTEHPKIAWYYITMAFIPKNDSYKHLKE